MSEVLLQRDVGYHAERSAPVARARIRQALLALWLVPALAASILHTSEAQQPAGPCRVCVDTQHTVAGVEQEIQKLREQIRPFEQTLQAQGLLMRLAALEQQLAALSRSCQASCGMASAPSPSSGQSPSTPTPPVAKAPTPGKVARLPFAMIGTHLDAALRGMSFRLHTYQGQGSFLQLGPPLGGQRIPLVLEEGVASVNVSGAPHAVRYWLNDVRSSQISVSSNAEHFVVSIGFESDGPELILSGSPPGMVPTSADVDDARMILMLTPAIDPAGHPSYGAVDANFAGRYSCQGGLLGPLCGPLAPMFGNYTNAQVRNSVGRYLMTSELRTRIGAVVWASMTSPAGLQQISQVAGAHVTRIRAVRLGPDAFALDYD